jgi:hypothetical protein
MTPFQAPSCSNPIDEPVIPLPEPVNQLSQTYPQRNTRPVSEFSGLTRKKSQKNAKATGFGGLPLKPGADKETQSADQNLPPSWIDTPNTASENLDDKTNLSSKCLEAKLKMANWCRSKLKRFESGNSYSRSEEHIQNPDLDGNTNLGFRYSES